MTASSVSFIVPCITTKNRYLCQYFPSYGCLRNVSPLQPTRSAIRLLASIIVNDLFMAYRRKRRRMCDLGQWSVERHAFGLWSTLELCSRDITSAIDEIHIFVANELVITFGRTVTDLMLLYCVGRVSGKGDSGIIVNAIVRWLSIP